MKTIKISKNEIYEILSRENEWTISHEIVKQNLQKSII